MDINEVIEKTVEFLENAPLHEEYMMSAIVHEIDTDTADDMDVMLDVNYRVRKRLEERGKRWLDSHKYDDAIIGLPYCIPFILRNAVTEPDRNPCEQ